MALTLGTTGMDSATEAELHKAFQQANASHGGRWQLVPEGDADYVVVDMDSMYGPMSWLRLHAAGKQVIGLTSAARTQTDFRLERPISAAAVSLLLNQITGGSIAPAAAAPAQSVPSGMSPSPEPEDQLPEEMPAKPREDLRAPTPTAPRLPESVAAGSLAPTTIEPAAPAPVVAPPPPPAPPREKRLGDWLGANELRGKVRYQQGAGPVLLIDADARQYHGPAALKPLAGYFDGAVERESFGSIDDATFAREATSLGAPQPLSRLQWYGGLLAGQGKLLPGFDPSAKYRLSKWPQTEREFPKHFRIATAMMKGPATLEEVTGASGVPHEDVIDFVNANLATGFAEVVSEQPPEPTDTQKGGLFGRLRGK
ncbi:hypothetical protein LK996_12125 [Lysobacter sp. A6]|uniref:Uncharacterized protein n=1 Tax=Noviluteimonas lactosilytica TaxID=2888523 RepID=A0ABS8JJN0_9GAMM|nr:hypothetical protein [Lysobacter lactosilyticus]MCC8363820.1 hypothetical protein [Lysobacter lactosilyticus]